MISSLLRMHISEKLFFKIKKWILRLIVIESQSSWGCRWKCAVCWQPKKGRRCLWKAGLWPLPYVSVASRTAVRLQEGEPLSPAVAWPGDLATSSWESSRAEVLRSPLPGRKGRADVPCTLNSVMDFGISMPDGPSVTFLSSRSPVLCGRPAQFLGTLGTECAQSVAPGQFGPIHVNRGHELVEHVLFALCPPLPSWNVEAALRPSEEHDGDHRLHGTVSWERGALMMIWNDYTDHLSLDFWLFGKK